MSYDLGSKLVIGIASSALFDLTESDRVFRQDGTAAYEQYQHDHVDDVLQPGVAFPFIQRLLAFNDLADGAEPLVEVIVMSRNDPVTGLRVMRSIESHRLPISRAAFTGGKPPYPYMEGWNMSLFLSANVSDVTEAIRLGFPAGRVLESAHSDRPDNELRVAFDFDGVLADDSSERVMRSGGLESFFAHEVANAVQPISPGPLRKLLAEINKIQRLEAQRSERDPAYQPRLRVSVVTARSAPSHERAIGSLRSWGVSVDDAFFLGGIDKGTVISVLRPDIFFDDQVGHLAATALTTPSVHVPFGVANIVDEMARPDSAADHTA